jgi:hypothetical protein
MSEVKKKCKYECEQTGWQCPHEALENSKEGFCIFHHRGKDEDKDKEKFTSGVMDILEDKKSDAYHLEGFFFPYDMDFSQLRLEKDVYFVDSEFSGERTLFDHTRFSGGRVRFDNAKFSGKAVSFYHCASKRELIFDKTYFGANTSFIGIDLRKCAFVEVDLTNVDFGLIEWDWKYKLANETMAKQLVKKQEKTELDTPRLHFLTCEVYRQLKVHFHGKRDFAKAGMFHTREQECNRKSSKLPKDFFGWIFLWILKLCSCHGERLRNVWWMSVFLIFVFAICYMFLGIHDADEHANLVFRYTLNSRNAAPITTILTDFGTSLIFSIKGFFPLWRFQQYRVVGDLANLVAGIEFLFGAFMVGLFIYVFRRRMKK